MENIQHSHNNTIDTILAISKKHGATYILPIICVIMGLLLVFSDGFALFIGIFLLFRGITKILSLRATSWMVTDEIVIIQSGYLPWKKRYLEIPKEDIYEAYYNYGFFGNLLGYGQISIRRTDGTTSYATDKGMNNPGELTGTINAIIREVKKRSAGGTNITNNNLNITNASLAEEIQKLRDLKQQGLLSEEEFTSLKRKMIEQ